MPSTTQISKQVSLNCNPKHFSNTEKPIKLVNKVILSFVENQHKQLGMPNQATHIIMDAFRSHITDDIISFLKENSVLSVLVLNNMIHLTVNKHCKSSLKRLFSE